MLYLYKIKSISILIRKQIGDFIEVLISALPLFGIQRTLPVIIFLPLLIGQTTTSNRITHNTYMKQVCKLSIELNGLSIWALF